MGINWNHLIYDAREEAVKRLEQSQEYQRAKMKCEEAENAIKAALPDHLKHLVIEWSDADNERNAVFVRELYLVGIRHGYELAKLLNHPVLAIAYQTKNLTESPLEIQAEDLMCTMDEKITSYLLNDQAYTTASQRVDDLYDAVKQELPADKVQMLIELDNAYTAKEAEKARVYYTAGLRHGNGMRTLLSPAR